MSQAATQIARLLDIMARLRDPSVGCPWDQAQDFATIAPYTIEEAYEVADAIARDDMAALPDELGDLLFQVVYHARLAEEAGHFAFADVARAIADKMVRRHPHVFGDAAARDAADQVQAWEAQKAAERRGRAEHGALAGVPVGLPALMRAEKLTRRAAHVGFDWPDAAAVLDKLDEESAELRAELAGADPARLADELGDMLFVLANLARKLGLDAEACLRGANDKFVRRFGQVEASLASEGRTPAEASLADMEAAWQAAKRAEGVAAPTGGQVARTPHPAPIRSVVAGDAAELGGVIAATGLFPSAMLDDMLSDHLAGRAEAVWLTFEDSRTALAYCAPERMTEGTWNLLLIAVHPDHQGQGRGSALLAHLERHLATRGARILLVETSGLPAFERTRAFYRACAFHQAARLRDFYQAGEDKIVFRKAL